MDYLQAMLLGLVQGLTEFLPVSSSGHLKIMKEVLTMTDPEEAGLLFDVLLHLGTLIAVVFVYRKTILKLIKTFFVSIPPLFRGELKWKNAEPMQRMIVLVIFSLLPLVFILPFKDFLENLPLRFVGFALIVNSVTLFICDRLVTGKKTAKNMLVRDSFIIGFVQLFAVLPGISRSGSTITAGVACGLKRKYAAEFSFIISIPTILASVLLELLDVLEMGIDTSLILVYISGMIVAAVSGFCAIKLLEMLLKSKRFIWFSVYCIIVGIFAVVWSFIT